MPKKVLEKVVHGGVSSEKRLGRPPSMPTFGSTESRLLSMKEVGKILGSTFTEVAEGGERMKLGDSELVAKKGEVFVKSTDDLTAKEAFEAIRRLELKYDIRLLIRHAKQWYLSPIGMQKLRQILTDGDLEPETDGLENYSPMEDD